MLFCTASCSTNAGDRDGGGRWDALMRRNSSFSLRGGDLYAPLPSTAIGFDLIDFWDGIAHGKLVPPALARPSAPRTAWMLP